jgi:thiamine pyrophosphokinase
MVEKLLIKRHLTGRRFFLCVDHARLKFMTTVILANGDIDAIEWLRPHVSRAATVLAADGGARHLFRLGIRPNRVFGDLDSIPADVLAWLRQGAVPVDTLPVEKDETDLEVALLHAISCSEDDIVVAGAFGGRFDQAFANVSLLARPELTDRSVTLITAHEVVRLLRPGRTVLHGQVGDLLSLLPFGQDVTVADSDGLRWPLRGDVLRFGPARGVSNRFEQAQLTITIASGLALCVHTSREWGR